VSCSVAEGVARYDESHPYYSLGRDIGRALAGLGVTVMTGGGPGLMEATNRGAREAGGRSEGATSNCPRNSRRIRISTVQ
jgi:hypothetical protein